MRKFVNKYIVLAGMMFGLLVFSPVMASAEDVFRDVCREKPNATVCKESRQTGNPLFGPNGIITTIIRIISILVGIAAVIMIIIGGLKFITSGSNPQDVSAARETVLYAIVGLVIAAAAQFIVEFFLVKIGA